jgi:hypothetical protein
VRVASEWCGRAKRQKHGSGDIFKYFRPLAQEIRARAAIKKIALSMTQAEKKPADAAIRRAFFGRAL